MCKNCLYEKNQGALGVYGEDNSDNGGDTKIFYKLSYEILRRNCANIQKKKILDFGKEMKENEHSLLVGIYIFTITLESNLSMW